MYEMSRTGKPPETAYRPEVAGVEAGRGVTANGFPEDARDVLEREVMTITQHMKVLLLLSHFSCVRLCATP